MIFNFRKIFLISVTFLAVLCATSSFAVDKVQTWDEKYREEPYVVLNSERTVELRKDFTTVTKVRMVAKIQKDAAKEYGEIPISFDKSREEVKDIQAFTITPEGEKLPYKDIQELNPKQDYAVYSDERIKMITMPNVVVGSVIDWQATVVSRKPVIENNFYDMVYFSAYYPMKAIKYTLIVPEGIKLNIKYINKERKPTVSHEKGKVIYVWESTNNEKVNEEEYMPSWEEVYETVAVSTLASWEDMSKWGWNLFRKNLQVSDAMKKRVSEISKGKHTLAEKVQAVLESIQNDFRYVAMSMDFHGYEPHPADQIYSNKYGDCKDYTLLGMAMLSEIGVKAYPVLFPSERALHEEMLLPMPSYFNHAILFFEMEGKKYFTDLLRKGYYFYEVPDAMSGRNVFVLSDKGGFFSRIPATDDDESRSLSEEHVSIQENGVAVTDMTTVLSRNQSIGMREAYKSMASDDREKMFASYESKLSGGGKILEKEWKNLDTPHGKIIFRLKYESSHSVQRVGNMMIFGMPQRQRGSLFTAHNRRYPIVFASNYKGDKMVDYSIPDGYEIINLPKSVKLNYDFGGYERTFQAKGNRIEGKEAFWYKESHIPAAEYDKIRNYYDDITRMTNDMVMIRKKEI